MSREYQICNRCIMDTTDPEIIFDKDGICNHCKNWFEVSKRVKLGNNEQELNRIAEEAKKVNKDKDYNCIIGVSGGVDSTYTALRIKELGLNPIAVHMDNGWNSELSVANIENILNKLNFDLYTNVLDWDEFKDLQLSFLKASTPDSEIPTDHAISATVHEVASNLGIHYYFAGYNHQTEGIMPRTWSHGHGDWKYIKSIQKEFGTKKLKSFPHKTLWQTFYYKRIKKIKRINLLNYIKYDKKHAMERIQNELDWRPYGGKHYESIYTRFFQGYILPKKFNIDKRRAHLSTLICAGQETRDNAIEEMEKDPYPSETMLREDREYVIKKLGIDEDEFERIMNLPPKTFWDYPSYETSWYLNFLLKITKFMRK